MTDATKTEDAQVTPETSTDETTVAEKLFDAEDDTETEDTDDTDKGTEDDEDKGDDEVEKEGDEDKEADDDEESKDDDSDDDESEEEESKAPEKYELELGEDSSLTEKDLERIATEGRELGLSNEEAQEWVKLEEKVTHQFQENQMKQVKEVRDSWIKDAEKDKEIGGDAFKENLELSKRVVDKFGSESLSKMLETTDFGNHPEVLRIFVRIGKLMGEDGLVHSKAPTGADRTMEDTFYGSESLKE